MDAVTINVVWTLAIFVSFIAIVLWAYSKRRKKDFDEAANLVFDDEKTVVSETEKDKRESSSNE
ncbi:cbb3-type cytochrome c oxidase subunit 3 [Aliiglaciecola sp. CAU 1673]|uniref:cbb3-type cytochrome oxidase subunit 3 n=1 Tax=Aliiglaciecola sp. CAU 1673 TaxID=3032595 RepID=UPI0023DA11A0|nr:cbb3-type cytochrome c oxidase subunit 3 [Aliiglaciecola sp. CAU 1673]MDF2180165.1 cbb3-type cytochrome c oxidase subunit 3 [Aliiglaciecola sp. CAU 1673]